MGTIGFSDQFFDGIAATIKECNKIEMAASELKQWARDTVFIAQLKRDLRAMEESRCKILQASLL